MSNYILYSLMQFIDAIAAIFLLGDEVVYAIIDQTLFPTYPHYLRSKEVQGLLDTKTICFLLPTHPHFAVIALKFITLQPNDQLHIILLCMLLLICYIDLKYLCIPDIFHVIFLLLFLCFQQYQIIPLSDRLIGACIISIPLLVINITTHAIGLGDVKLMASIGLLLGYRHTVLAFYLASFCGGLYSFFFVLTNKIKKGHIVPFAPPLCIGIYLSYLLGDSLLHWLLQ